MRIAGDGVQLNLEVSGPADGTPVVFLHGVSGSLETFGWLPPEITDGRRIIRVDLRGHGRSERAPGGYDVPRYAADVIALLAATAPERPAVLVGHSLGAVVAWTVAQRAPQRVAAAFLEDPPLYMGEPAAHATNHAVPVFVGLRDTAIDWQWSGAEVEAVAAQLAEGPMGQTHAPDALRSRAVALLHMDPGVLDGAIDGSTLAGTDTVAAVDRPTRLLAADEAFGSAFARAHEERLAASHPGVEVLRLNGVGHSIHDDRAMREVYVRELGAFLDAVR